MLWLLMLSACGMDATLTVDQASYQPGDSVTLTLRNRSLARLGYNLCRVDLRAADGSQVDDQAEGACPAILVFLESGASTTGRGRLPAVLPEGGYLYRTSVEGSDGQNETLDSPAFRVAAQ